VAAFVLESCSVTVDPDFDTAPPPIAQRLPFRVGVYYPPETREYHANGPTWLDVIYLGPATVALFNDTFGAMFNELVEVPQWPPPAGDRPSADIVVALSVDEFWLQPDATRCGISYRVIAYTPDGMALANWVVPGLALDPQKIDAKLFRWNQYNEVARVAMLDAARTLAGEFSYQPGIRKWLGDRGITVPD